MIETRRLKNVATFVQTILSFVLSRKIILGIIFTCFEISIFSVVVTFFIVTFALILRSSFLKIGITKYHKDEAFSVIIRKAIFEQSLWCSQHDTLSHPEQLCLIRLCFERHLSPLSIIKGIMVRSF